MGDAIAILSILNRTLETVKEIAKFLDLKTIKNSDIILIMNNGQIEETGTHAELMKKMGFIKPLANAKR